jgi:hypothetical protein
LRHGIDRRTLRRERPYHRPVLDSLPVPSHFASPLSPPDLRIVSERTNPTRGWSRGQFVGGSTQVVRRWQIAAR